MRSNRLTKEEALAFLLTHIVIEKAHVFEMDPGNLFAIMNMAAAAELQINREEGAIPHEVIESIASEFLNRNAT